MEVDFVRPDFVAALKNHTFAFLEDPDVILSHHIFVVVILLFMPVIIVSNVLVFWGIYLYPGFHTTNNYLLLSLSVADFIMGAYTIPMYALSYIPYTKEAIFCNKYACLAWFASIMTSGAGSLYTLLFISIDRYVAVMWPLNYNNLVTEKRMINLVIAIWTYTITQAFLPMMGYNNYDPRGKPLPVVCNFYTTLPAPYVIWGSFGTVGTCIGISAILYAQILTVAYTQVLKFRKHHTFLSRDQIKQFERRVNSVKITSLLMLLFIILWLPYVLIAPFKYYNVFSQKRIEILKVISQVLNFGNSLVNAPLYAVGREEYRVVFKTMLRTHPLKWKSKLKSLHRAMLVTSQVYASHTEDASRNDESQEADDECVYPEQRSNYDAEIGDDKNTADASRKSATASNVSGSRQKSSCVDGDEFHFNATKPLNFEQQRTLHRTLSYL